MNDPIYNIFHCEPSYGGWFCKCISSSKDDPTPYLGEPIDMGHGDGSVWFLMDDLSMLQLRVVIL